MEKELKNIPELRFPEFIKLGDWEKTKIESIISQESSTMAMNKLELLKEGFPVYGADGLIGYINDFQQEEEYISMVKDGSGVGKLNLCQEHSSILGTLTALKSKDSKRYFLKWIYYLLNTLDFSSYVKGAGIPHIYYSDIKHKCIYIPSFSEQEKIADCLSSLDDYINATQEKIEILQAHKKGLMQQLLPALGKIMPQKRLPKFGKSKKWSPYSMEEMFKIRNGYTPSKSNPKFWENGTIPWFRMEDIREHGHILSDSIQHITKEAVKGKGLFPANSIIVATTATIGEHALIIVDSLANQQFTFLTKRKSFDTQINMKYFYYYMYIIDEWCKQHTNAGGFASVDMNGFKRLSVSLPSPEEQKEITECFTSIDDLIDSTKQKLVMLQNHKRGLMQQLFPII